MYDFWRVSGDKKQGEKWVKRNYAKLENFEFEGGQKLKFKVNN